MRLFMPPLMYKICNYLDINMKEYIILNRSIANKGHFIESSGIKKKILADLRDKGFKHTPQRLIIIDILANTKSHPSAQTIFRQAREKAPKISMSTVYYTLNLLKEHKLIRELEFYDMDNRYEANTDNHLNLICVECGKIQDYNDELPFSHRDIEEQTGFKALEMRLEYYGYCTDCMKNK
jgi:Fur family peroxide stress response transcriptional regulator